MSKRKELFNLPNDNLKSKLKLHLKLIKNALHVCDGSLINSACCCHGFRWLSSYFLLTYQKYEIKIDE